MNATLKNVETAVTNHFDAIEDDIRSFASYLVTSKVGHHHEVARHSEEYYQSGSHQTNVVVLGSSAMYPERGCLFFRIDAAVDPNVPTISLVATCGLQQADGESDKIAWSRAIKVVRGSADEDTSIRKFAATLRAKTLTVHKQFEDHFWK